MALELNQLLSQKMVMTPQLKQAIKLLQLNRIELQDYIDVQLNENPVLEQDSSDFSDIEPVERQTTGEDMMSNQLAEGGLDNRNAEKIGENIDWDQVSQNAAPVYTPKTMNPDDIPSLENTLVHKETLHEYLASQLQLISLSDVEKNIGYQMIGAIDEDGYFRFSIEEFATSIQQEVILVEGMLDTIQRLDPIGVGARDLQECLLIQLKHFHLQNGIVEVIVKKHIHHLETHNVSAIAKSLSISNEEVLDNIRIISELEPKPGRPFGGQEATYVVPDLFVVKDGDKWIIQMNEDGMPKLKISQFYNSMLKQHETSKDEKDYIQDKLKAAVWLIKSIQHRQKTIYRVMESILDHQQDFFEHGISHLKPMILKDIAEKIEMHESTVSRVTTNKYVHTPRGIFELKFFFNSSVSKTEGVDTTTETAKEFVRKVIAAEDARKPLSDQEIVEKLKRYGIDLARRTAAKYREQLGILPSSKRKKYF